MVDKLQKGFTLVELIVVLVIMSVLTAIAMPIMSNDEFNEANYTNELMFAIRYAHKVAIAQRTQVRISVATQTYGLDMCEDNLPSCNTFNINVFDPGSGASTFTGRSTNGISVSPTANIIFNALGQANASHELSVNTRKICVVQETGYVYDTKVGVC